jgi:hypothetical protein
VGNVTEAGNAYPYIFFSFTGKQAIMNKYFISIEPEDIYRLKQKIDGQLEDLKEMLEHKRLNLPDAEWTDFVHLARKSILEHPDQYLEGELPTAETLSYVVNAVFDDFLKSVLKK